MPRDDAAARRANVRRTDHPPGGTDAVRSINETLKGPVAAIFRSLVPAFAPLGGDEFYETVLDSSEMLHGCILIFRRHQDAFRTVLVDERGRPVNDDFVRLRCGRSVHDVIAMVVRTHAKRHFRATLGGNPNDPTSKAGRLYQAMSEYLIHDWQVPLVPHYAPLPVHKVLEMGPRLLDVREAELLDAIAVAAGPPPAPRLPDMGEPPRFEVVPPGGGPGRSGFSGTPQEEFWWGALDDKAAVAVIGSRGNHEMRELVATLAGVNEAVRSELFAGLSLSTVQAAVCLVSAHKTLGRAAFAATFGVPGKPAVVETIAGRLRKRNVGSQTELRALAGLTEGAVRG
ncbi:hypothetical protein [Magnetospirillum sp. SS-4]|uniref:hypothetical protein n=1 Tax=Magnetospirillum sp. SS-4 TaxID=2681465 RepID=UPI0013804A48|nr:hypothetical protein [Magnetospirillum sp. SS-4]CAA7619838.1 conserved hypothetical protein [Magnetospirillum sp. SS-4]